MDDVGVGEMVGVVSVDLNAGPNLTSLYATVTSD